MPALRVREDEGQEDQEDDGEGEEEEKVIAQAIKSSLAAALGCLSTCCTFAPK